MYLSGVYLFGVCLVSTCGTPTPAVVFHSAEKNLSMSLCQTPCNSTRAWIVLVCKYLKIKIQGVQVHHLPPACGRPCFSSDKSDNKMRFLCALRNLLRLY